MLLGDWCCSSQDDQNARRLSHLYSNYRCSRDKHLISNVGIDAFNRALSATDVSLLRKIPVDGGIANAIVSEAQHQFYRTAIRISAGITDDFRISGQAIVPPRYSEVFVNLYRRPLFDRPNSTGGPRSRVGPPAVPAYAIRWLTRPEIVLGELQKASLVAGSGLDELQTFRELVALLGLKASKAARSSYGLQLYRVRTSKALRRPHALSTGYEDRFCGISPYRPFGATADNRSGMTGLPEAIAFEADLELIPPTDKIYGDFRTSLERVAPWIYNVPPSTRIESTLITAHVHEFDLDYMRLQPIIIKRLRGNRKMCRYHHGVNSCCCF